MSGSITSWLAAFRDGDQDAAQRLWNRYYTELVSVARAADHADFFVSQIDDGGWAVVLPNCDRQNALALAHRWQSETSNYFARSSRDALPPVALSIGAATLAAVPINFSAERLLEAAERCLYGARSSGGGTVKSIEL